MRGTYWLLYRSTGDSPSEIPPKEEPGTPLPRGSHSPPVQPASPRALHVSTAKVNAIVGMVAQYAVRELVRGRVLGRPGRVLENYDHQYVKNTARDCRLVGDY